MSFQYKCWEWVGKAFGTAAANDPLIRVQRFLEEAIELAQALGFSHENAHKMVDYVYGRPVGEVTQEVGGVMCTLGSTCEAIGVDMHMAGTKELLRAFKMIEVIKEKNKLKPKFGPQRRRTTMTGKFFRGRFNVVCGKEHKHVATLKFGLFRLGEDFLAQVCWKCEGTTKYDYWGCAICGATGLLQGNEAAPLSVLNQVLVAAEWGTT